MFNDKYGLTEAVLTGRKTMTRRVVPAKVAQMIEAFAKPTLLVPLNCVPSGMSMEEFEKQWKNFDAPLVIHRSSEEEVKFYDARQEAIKFATYKIGEEIAIAQSYHELNKRGFVAPEWCEHTCEDSAGWNNKMFVRADLMPHRIRITDIRVERLQDISDEDCLMEGIIGQTYGMFTYVTYSQYVDMKPEERERFCTPRAAFAALINKVSGRGTWERNPWVFVYEFELLKK